jgi:hypothetical protein
MGHGANILMPGTTGRLHRFAEGLIKTCSRSRHVANKMTITPSGTITPPIIANNVHHKSLMGRER